MSGNKPKSFRSWTQDDVYVKEMVDGAVERKRKTLCEERADQLTNSNELWNVTKKKRSVGSRIRSANVGPDCIGDNQVLAFTPAMDGEAAQDVIVMNTPTLSKHQKKLLPNGHIEKFLEGNLDKKAGVTKRKLKPILSEALVLHKKIVSTCIDERSDVNKSAVKFPNNGGPLLKMLLSALIDENQDLDHPSDEKIDSSPVQKWEMDFLDFVPDENLLLKELHLIGIYPEILPGLVEKEEETDKDKEEMQNVTNSKLASELTLVKRGRGRPRSKNVKNPIIKEKNTSSPKKKRGRKPKNPNVSSYPKERNSEIQEENSERVTRSVPEVSMQEAKSLSHAPSTEQLITKDISIQGLEILDIADPSEDISLMLNIDDLDDYLPQDDDDFSCLEIPMDDISSLNFNFWS